VGQPSSTAAIGRTAVVGAYLVALVLVGRPMWLALLLGAVLVLVWVAPIALAPPPRRRSTGVTPGSQ
jgi:hypothetical protein